MAKKTAVPSQPTIPSSSVPNPSAPKPSPSASKNRSPWPISRRKRASNHKPTPNAIQASHSATATSNSDRPNAAAEKLKRSQASLFSSKTANLGALNGFWTT